MNKSARTSKRTSVPKTKQNREQHGASKIMLIAIIAIVLLVGVGGYFLSQKTGIQVVPGMKTSLNPNCSYNDPNLCKFINNWANPRDYTMTSSSKMQGMTMESVYTINGNNFQMSSKHNEKENSNMIVIGDTSYTLDYSDNKWWKQTSKPEDTTEMNEMKTEFKDAPEDSSVDTTKYTFVTKEACGENTCFKYEAGMPGSENGKQFIWFDDHEYLLRKISMVDPSGITSDTIYTYNNINVTAPTQVKEGNPYSGSNPAGYSEVEAKKMMEQYQQNATDTSSEMPVEDTSADGF